LDLAQQAIEILRANDRGDYTVPTATGLYPAQWNWDSYLVALGLAQFDEPRAVTEIETLLGGQWPDGMVPHILFHGDDSTYFPNSSVWRAGPTRRSSGITQPLVAATVVRRLFERTADVAIRSRLTALLPKLLAWHRWCYSARDPYGTGMVSIIHPWESGMDNSPLWDDALSAVEPGPSVTHLRRDTGFAANDERPTGPEYDRYINLVIRFRDNDYRTDRLYDISPFRVADIGFNAILQRANQDLRFLLAASGDVAGAAEVATMEQKTEAAIARCWHEEDGFFYGIDTRTSATIRKPGIAGLLPLFADTAVAARHPPLLQRLESWLARVAYGVPSFEPGRPEFEPQRYWRGPVWLIVNWMLVDGLRRSGRADLAARIRHDSLALVERTGFAEYFNPLTGEPLGGSAFSWTAAIYLHFAAESE
jgi:mannosylglycerate hydrolase